ICSNASFVCSQATFLGAGATLPFSPKNRVTVTGTFTVPMDEAMGRLALSATYVHTDKQISSYSNATAFAQGALPYNAGISPATDL
ncbi:hypothetical protein, partial [Staphylococcus aureus]|uniref:hypothetical protein n=1 Tax=Staphylococcus aureus TaxID=1280 RepID=UPI0035D45958